MDGNVAGFLFSTNKYDVAEKAKIFEKDFQHAANWLAFFRKNLTGGSVVQQLHSSYWCAACFQGLFVACWLHHPTEKGTYMIDLSRLPGPHILNIQHAISGLPSRPSSHMSGKGHSASSGWKFLKGYSELLIQFEATSAAPSLLLKVEGHQLWSLMGFCPHAIGYVKKEWMPKRLGGGSGLTANSALKSMARTDPRIESRAAENFEEAYKKFIKLVGGNKSMTIRQLIQTMHERFEGEVDDSVSTMDAGQLGHRLSVLMIAHREKLVEIHPQLLSDLQGMVIALRQDAKQITDRVFKEVRATGEAIDASIANFSSFIHQAQTS
jgi:type IV secretory pathway TrbD component